MREFALMAAIAFSAFGAGVSSVVLAYSVAGPKCECPCCKPDQVQPHRPFRPNGSTGSTGSIGSLGAE
jgi:hypothetical protein